MDTKWAFNPSLTYLLFCRFLDFHGSGGRLSVMWIRKGDYCKISAFVKENMCNTVSNEEKQVSCVYEQQKNYL